MRPVGKELRVVSNRVESRELGRWTNYGTVRTVYSSWWLSLTLDRVEKPDGSIVDHEVVRGPDAAGMVVVNEARQILMIWRHRFMPDTWGWEIPGGAVDSGESPAEAARRECLEETGWEVSGDAVHLGRHHPSCGLVSQTFDLYLAGQAEWRHDPADRNEAARVAWRSAEEVADDLGQGRISDGFTLLAITLSFIRMGMADVLRPALIETVRGGNEEAMNEEAMNEQAMNDRDLMERPRPGREGGQG